MNDEHIPVLVGVGEVKAPVGAERPTEPRDLVIDAVRRAWPQALEGARLDGVGLTHTASWAYDDLPGAVAAALGGTPAHTFAAPVGGQWPTRLLDAAAQRIATGASRVEVVAGGEGQASVTRAGKEGVDVVADWGWSAEPGGPPAFDLDQLGSQNMQNGGLLAPTRVYPLFESALRARLGHSVGQADAWSAALYSAFSEAAAANPIAWRPEALTPAELLAVGPGNRMVCEPYRLTMNAMPFVDQAAALVLTDLATARQLGLADSVVYVWGGAGAQDTSDVLARPDLSRSLALENALERTLAASRVTASDLDVIDVYSCFPVVPKLVIDALGLPDDAVPTVTGGHSAFGGPLSSYSLHSLAATYRHLLATDGGGLALVHANGGYVTYQHCTLLSTRPSPRGFVGDPEPAQVADPRPPTMAALAVDTSTEVTVEAATVEHGRDGAPQQAYLVARTDGGDRVAVQTGDVASATALTIYPDGYDSPGREVVGRRVRLDVTADGVRVS